MTEQSTPPENVPSAPQADNATKRAWTDAPETKAADKTAGAAGESWERDLVARVAFAAVSEQRRARRWGIFFKMLGFAYIAALFMLYFPMQDDGLGGIGRKHTALVDVNGVIADNEAANADDIVGDLRAAFEDEHSVGIILRINSPGGSPVQAGYVNDEIKRLRGEFPDKKLYAVVSDICASGGYYMAAAADEIYADKASLVGSIGVLMDGFGFTGTMDKLGVERRLMTAGTNKGFLDPFSPMKESDREHMRKILDSTHQQFINVVKSGRGDRLKETPETFSGLIWTGEQALELGLIDGLGSAGYVAREIIGEERIVNYTHEPTPLERFAERIGASMGKSVTSALGLAPGKLQ